MSIKTFTDESLKKLMSLIKDSIATKQDAITATGVLKREESGVITSVDTEAATLVDIPVGLLKGDGTTITAAVAGTDYIKTAPVTKVNSKTGEVSLAAADVGAVPTTRTVNGKALSANISLSAADVSALALADCIAYTSTEVNTFWNA